MLRKLRWHLRFTVVRNWLLTWSLVVKSSKSKWTLTELLYTMSATRTPSDDTSMTSTTSAANCSISWKSERLTLLELSRMNAKSSLSLHSERNAIGVQTLQSVLQTATGDKWADGVGMRGGGGGRNRNMKCCSRLLSWCARCIPKKCCRPKKFFRHNWISRFRNLKLKMCHVCLSLLTFQLFIVSQALHNN